MVQDFCLIMVIVEKRRIQTQSGICRKCENAFKAMPQSPTNGIRAVTPVFDCGCRTSQRVFEVTFILAFIAVHSSALSTNGFLHSKYYHRNSRSFRIFQIPSIFIIFSFYWSTHTVFTVIGLCILDSQNSDCRLCLNKQQTKHFSHTNTKLINKKKVEKNGHQGNDFLLFNQTSTTNSKIFWREMRTANKYLYFINKTLTV